MRRLAFAALLGCFTALACSRRETPELPPPPAKESTTTTTLSGSVEVAVDAGITTSAKPASTSRSLAGKKVLHVGDSMVGGHFGLTRALETKLGEEGATIVRHTKVSETLASFDKAPTFRDLLRTHDPDIVIITLGANDATVPYPEAYARNVENIVRRVGDRECWWIGPPSWKGPDSGLISVIQDHADSCHFFDSTKLELDRATDGIHPNDRGAAKWADAFWAVFRAP